MADKFSAERRKLPWVKVSKKYVFDGAHGKETLADLFEGRSQLIIYHFMFGPDDKVGCKHCSLRADGFNGINAHLKHRDVTMIARVACALQKVGVVQETHGLGFQMGLIRQYGF